LRGDPRLKNVVTGALTGGATAGIGSLASEYLPTTGNLEEQIRTPGYTPTPVSGSTFLDNLLRTAAIRTPGTLIRGGNLGDIAVGSLATEAGKTVAGSVPGKGADMVDSLVNAWRTGWTHRPQTHTALNGSGGSGGSANSGGGTGSVLENGSGGGGWGASGGSFRYSGGAGGKAVALNGNSITWVSGNTTRVYGAVS